MCHTESIIEIGNKKINVDSCLEKIIKILNDNGIKTIASCCGHGKQPGTIAIIIDDQELEIRLFTYKQARKIDKLFPSIN